MNQQVRNLIETIRTADLTTIQNLDELSGQIAAVTAALQPAIVEGERMQIALDAMGRTIGAPRPDMDFDDPQAFFPYSPVIGRLNPISPPATFRRVGEEIHGEVTFGSAFNGPPGSAHGGMIALVLDEVLGGACMAADMGSFTGTLSIRYEQTVPLDTECQLHGWVDRVEGRKVFANGEIRLGDVVLARAEGLFIRPVLAEAPAS